jgi:diguanylate cyclase (GGDEF)-like protein
MRKGDVVARLSGNEFIVSLHGLAARRRGAPIAQKILPTTAEPVSFEGKPLKVTASIGVANFPQDAEDPGLLIRFADSAMCRAKGRNALRFYQT